MHTKINLTVENVRGINELSKRQQLAATWYNDNIDIALVSETQKNTGGMETGPTWGNEFIAFFSTGISPKARETAEKQRESKGNAKKRTRKRKIKPGDTIPTPMAKAKKPTESSLTTTTGKGKGKNLNKGKIKGKGYGPSKQDKDYEHAGVGIVIRKNGRTPLHKLKRSTAELCQSPLTQQQVTSRS
jgi:hypothetical protein